jgi:uncharacterized protein (TIGR03067 family)
MRCRLLFAGALLVALGCGRDHGADEGLATMDDKQRLQGTWRAVSYESQGEAHPEGEEPTEVIIEDNRITFKDSKQSATATFTIDPSKQPREIDIRVVGSVVNPRQAQGGKPAEESKLLTAKGIYELEGKTLKLCIADHDGDRPTAFASPKGSHQTLYTLEKKQ